MRWKHTGSKEGSATLKLFNSNTFGTIVGNCKVINKLRFLQWPTSADTRRAGS